VTAVAVLVHLPSAQLEGSDARALDDGGQQWAVHSNPKLVDVSATFST
jgi:hypothetical protein